MARAGNDIVALLIVVIEEMRYGDNGNTEHCAIKFRCTLKASALLSWPLSWSSPTRDESPRRLSPPLYSRSTAPPSLRWGSEFA